MMTSFQMASKPVSLWGTRAQDRFRRSSSCCEVSACDCGVRRSDCLVWGWKDEDACPACKHPVNKHLSVGESCAQAELRAAVSTKPRPTMIRQVLSTDIPEVVKYDTLRAFEPAAANAASASASVAAARPYRVDPRETDFDMAIALSASMITDEKKSKKDTSKEPLSAVALAARYKDEAARLLEAIEESLGETALPPQSEGYLKCDHCEQYFKPEAAAVGGRPGCPNPVCRARVFEFSMFGEKRTRAPDHLHRDLDRGSHSH